MRPSAVRPRCSQASASSPVDRVDELGRNHLQPAGCARHQAARGKLLDAREERPRSEQCSRVTARGVKTGSSRPALASLVVEIALGLAIA